MLEILVALNLTAAAGQPSLEVLVKRVESRHERLRDFQALFSQRYFRRAIRKSVEERGTVAIKRPGLMRWEYEKPERKLFITDGAKSYFYLPEERQLIVSYEDSRSPRLKQGSPLGLLAGRSRLSEAFEVSYSATEPAAGGVRLRLLPRQPQDELSEAELEVDPEEGQIRRLVLVDAQGNRTEFAFEKIRENRGLPDSLFRFNVPAGVDVLLASDPGPYPPADSKEP